VIIIYVQTISVFYNKCEVIVQKKICSGDEMTIGIFLRYGTQDRSSFFIVRVSGRSYISLGSFLGGDPQKRKILGSIFVPKKQFWRIFKKKYLGSYSADIFQQVPGLLKVYV
jgi:hypothetical protein